MQGAIWLILLTAVAPAAAALAVAALCRKFAPADWSERSALPLGVAMGFCAGYWLLPDWAPLWPDRHWQWLPYLALAAAIAGALPEKAGRLVRWPALVAVAIGAAWLLVPTTWDHLYPPRNVSVALVAAYLLLLTLALDALPDRLLGRVFCGALLATLAVLTVLLLAIGASAKIAQLSAIASAAMVGGFAAMFLFKLATANAARGVVPVFAILAGGLAYVGTIEPEIPQPLLLLAPAAPLAWWLLALWKPRVAPAGESA